MRNDGDKQQSITNMKRNTSKKHKAQPDALSEVVHLQQTSSNKKHNSTNIVKLEEDASKNKREPDNRDHTNKPFASNSNDDVVMTETPLIILGHHHYLLIKECNIEQLNKTY